MVAKVAADREQVTPLRFESSPGRDLFGLHHAPARPIGVAVLMLAPLSQEAVRAHRLMRVMADRLTRSGVDVLRFDYYGTGDSGGDDGDADFASWPQDIRAAHHVLIERSGCRDVRWLGLRLGFTAGLYAAAADDWPQGGGDASLACPPGWLAGWDPVLDGEAYWRELAIGHAAALRASFSLPTVPEAELKRLAALPVADEALGFALSPKMVAAIRRIGKTPWPMLRPGRPALGAIGSRRRIGSERLAERLAEGLAETPDAAGCSVPARLPLTVDPVAVDFDWVSEEALNTPLVPDAALRRLMRLLNLE